MSDEEWKAVPEHPGYAASSHGRIRGKRGILTGTSYDNGYVYVHIYMDGRRVHRSVHRLVLLAFHGQPCDGQEARHLNGNATDNRPTNLAWGTHAENNQDRVRHGTHHEAAKTHCIHGHEFTDANTYRPARGGRQCRACRRDRRR